MAKSHLTKAEKRAKFLKNQKFFISGIALNFEPLNNLIGGTERSVFAFDFFPKEQSYGEMIKVYVPNELRKRCIEELQNFDNIEIKILKLEGNYDKNSFKLLDFHFLKRPKETGSWTKRKAHLLKRCELLKHADEHRHDYVCKFVQITYSKPQELRTVYAKPVTIIIDPCLWGQDYIYYIDVSTDKLRRIKKDQQVKVKHSYAIDELNNVDPRLMAKYKEIKEKIKVLRTQEHYGHKKGS